MSLPKLTHEIVDAETAEGNRRLQCNEDVQPAFTYELSRATEDDPVLNEFFLNWRKWSKEYFDAIHADGGIKPNLVVNHILIFGAKIVNMLKRAAEELDNSKFFEERRKKKYDAHEKQVREWEDRRTRFLSANGVKVDDVTGDIRVSDEFDPRTLELIRKAMVDTLRGIKNVSSSEPWRTKLSKRSIDNPTNARYGQPERSKWVDRLVTASCVFFGFTLGSWGALSVYEYLRDREADVRQYIRVADVREHWSKQYPETRKLIDRSMSDGKLTVWEYEAVERAHNVDMKNWDKEWKERELKEAKEKLTK